MFERHIAAVHLVDADGLDNAALRERLKPNFPAGTARRMTLLGMMVGTALRTAATGPIASLTYSSEFGESIALEGYLKSFPTASPTLFQTSIHPSALQQTLILQQQPISEIIPLAGGPELVLQAALAALIPSVPEVVWCGGDERGTWLRELGVAAERSFAFALVLQASPGARSVGRLRLAETDRTGRISLAEWFDVLRARTAWAGPVGEGWELSIDWT